MVIHCGIWISNEQKTYIISWTTELLRISAKHLWWRYMNVQYSDTFRNFLHDFIADKWLAHTSFLIMHISFIFEYTTLLTVLSMILFLSLWQTAATNFSISPTNAVRINFLIILLFSSQHQFSSHLRLVNHYCIEILKHWEFIRNYFSFIIRGEKIICALEYIKAFISTCITVWSMLFVLPK